MKICLLSSAQSVHTQQWAKYLASRGNEVSVISFARGTIPGVSVVSCTASDTPSRLDIVRSLGHIKRLVRSIDPDIVHAHYVTSYGLAAAMAEFRPFVASAWGSDILIAAEQSFLRRQMVRRTLKSADLVVSVAAHMTALIKRRNYVPHSERLVTLPFGVDLSQFNLNLRIDQPGHPLVVSTRYLENIYDVKVLIKAIPLIAAECPAARFVIAGDGSCDSELRRLASSTNVASLVTFLGAVENSEIKRLLSRAAIYVSTSRSDGASVSLMEAMACGAYPVVSDIPGNREWLTTPLNGSFFPVGGVRALAGAVVASINDHSKMAIARNENWKIVNERGCFVKNMALIEREYERLITGETPVESRRGADKDLYGKS